MGQAILKIELKRVYLKGKDGAIDYNEPFVFRGELTAGKLAQNFPPKEERLRSPGLGSILEKVGEKLFINDEDIVSFYLSLFWFRRVDGIFLSQKQ